MNLSDTGESSNVVMQAVTNAGLMSCLPIEKDETPCEFRHNNMSELDYSEGEGEEEEEDYSEESKENSEDKEEEEEEEEV